MDLRPSCWGATELAAQKSVGARDFVLALILLIIISMPLWVKPVLGIPSVFAVVEGHSMEPILHTGDLILLLPKDPEEIHVGDIVVFKEYDSYVIHRVVHVYKDDGRYCYVTWGDNRLTNKVPDFGNPSMCHAVTFTDPYTGKRATANGIPYSSIVGVAVTFNGYVIKIPYIGSITLTLRK